MKRSLDAKGQIYLSETSGRLGVNSKDKVYA